MTGTTVGDFYNEPGMEWSLRSVGRHLHPGSEEATVALASRAEAAGFAHGGVIVEIASALGAPARLIARKFSASVVCIDMDRRMHLAAVQANRDEGLGRVVQPLLARTERLPLAAASCDGAWSQDALCHMQKDAVLLEIARVLKPGALLAFTDFIGHSSITAADLDALGRLWAFPSLYGIPRYVASLEAAGFEVLLAEDRTAAITSTRRGGLPDDDLWWHDFREKWGEAEAQSRLEAGGFWQSLLQ
ncbi:MAG: class I SAM-dependent methyltransferase, partial [Dehalococcoidia bacterium]